MRFRRGRMSRRRYGRGRRMSSRRRIVRRRGRAGRLRVGFRM